MAITRRTWRRLAFIVVMKDSLTPVNTENKNKYTGSSGLICRCSFLWTKSTTYWLWQFGKIMIEMVYLLSTPNRGISLTADKSRILNWNSGTVWKPKKDKMTIPVQMKWQEWPLDLGCLLTFGSIIKVVFCKLWTIFTQFGERKRGHRYPVLEFVCDLCWNRSSLGAYLLFIVFNLYIIIIYSQLPNFGMHLHHEAIWVNKSQLAGSFNGAMLIKPVLIGLLYYGKKNNHNYFGQYWNHDYSWVWLVWAIFQMIWKTWCIFSAFLSKKNPLCNWELWIFPFEKTLKFRIQKMFRLKINMYPAVLQFLQDIEWIKVMK